MSKLEEKFIEELLNKEYEIILGFQEYEKQIADLEAKLAEKSKWLSATDKHIKELKQKLTEKEKQVNTYAKEIVFLDRKIQEKDKEIEDYKNGNVFILSARQNGKSNLIIRQFNEWQNRIAIEQLEKVKEFLFEQNIEITRLNKISDFIDNQIKQLKEGK